LSQDLDLLSERKKLASGPEQAAVKAEIDAEIKQLQQKRKRFGEIKSQLENLKNSLKNRLQSDRPFDHPQYWAAFRCEGLVGY
jgi:hypothetical protein